MKEMSGANKGSSVNHRLYILLTSSSLLLFALSALLHVFLDETYISQCIQDISLGLLAGVVFAWLIDGVNSKNAQKELALMSTAVYWNFQESVELFFRNLIYVVYVSDEQQYDELPLQCHEWANRLSGINLHENRYERAIKNECYERLNPSVLRLEESIRTLNANKFMLYQYSLITRVEYEQLAEILQLCSLSMVPHYDCSNGDAHVALWSAAKLAHLLEQLGPPFSNIDSETIMEQDLVPGRKEDERRRVEAELSRYNPNWNVF